MACSFIPSFTTALTNMPGRRSPSGFGNTSPQDDGPGRGIYRDVAKQKRPFQSILCAVFQNKLDFVLVRSVSIQAAVFQASLQSQQFGGGLGHIHVNGVQLLNGCQGQGLISRHQERHRSRWTCRCARRWER